jgi:hypothetical protein
MIRIRPMTVEDGTALCELGQRNGLWEMDVALWRSHWETHPFSAEFRSIPIGWVLDCGDGLISGAFVNEHILYELAGQRLLVCIGSNWGVEPNSRGSGLGLQLLNAFLNQKGVDVCILGSASVIGAQIFTKLKLDHIPAPGYDKPYIWAVRPRTFAASALRKKGVPGAGALAWPVGVGLMAADFVRGSGRGRLKSTVRRLSGFDERFDAFWEKLRTGPRRLRAVRNRAALEWRYGTAPTHADTIVIVSERDGELTGYAVLVDRVSTDMKVCDVADVQALADTSILRDLLLGSVPWARESGADVLKLMTANAEKQAVASALRPHRYTVPLWQLFYKAENPALAKQLSASEVWDFSWFDTY